MEPSGLDRRDFHKRLTSAAMGGLLAGTLAGCGGGPTTRADKGDKTKPQDKETAKAAKPLLEEPHTCRGLNTCKGKGAGGKNNCAGQGNCATAEKHECRSTNACKGQGGCGEHPGENACKGQGECAVPLSDKAWTKARKRFEEMMAKEGKKAGAAPKKAGS